MTRALILSEHDLDAWGERFQRAEVPARLPYGVDALRNEGWSLTWASRSAHLPWGKVRDVIEHRAGFPVERALRGAASASRSDVVVALLEQQGAAVSMARRLRLPPYGSTPLVLFSVWLAEEIRSASPGGRRRLAKRYAGADLITHMSVHETEIFEDAGISRDRTLPVTFGVNDDYYTPSDAPRDIQLLAVGQDRGRDYRTLFDAVRGTDLVLNLVCAPANVAGLDVPHNIRLMGIVPLAEYRQLLRRARVVVVPTHELAYPTGQSVALEAASTGACVAVTGTQAMREYFEDGTTARLVDVGDADGWKELLHELRDDPAQTARLGASARIAAQTKFSAQMMWAEIAAACAARGLV